MFPRICPRGRVDRLDQILRVRPPVRLQQARFRAIPVAVGNVPANREHAVAVEPAVADNVVNGVKILVRAFRRDPGMYRKPATPAPCIGAIDLDHGLGGV